MQINSLGLSRLGSSGSQLWYKAGNLKLNNVSPSFIHDYTLNRYYNTTDGATGFPFLNTRTTGAMMFNSDGDLVWAPVNMLARSTPTSGTQWGIIAATATDGYEDNFGGTEGVKLVANLGISTILNDSNACARLTPNLTVNSGGYYCFVFYAKANDLTGVRVREPVSTGARALISLIDGSVTTENGTTNNSVTGINITTSAEEDGWWKIKVTRKATASTFNMDIKPGIDIGDGVSGVFIANVMVHPYDGTDKLFIKTTGSAYYGHRLDYNPATLAPRGYLIETQRTNSIRNNMLIGGVAGSPGTVPTNWSISSIAGVTITTAYGVENNIPYIDITYSGTNTSGALAYPTITPEQANNIAAASGQSWTHSAFVKKIAGADNENNWNVGLVGRDSGGSIVSGESAVTDFVGASRLSASRVQVTRTFANAAVAFTQPRFTRDALGIGESMDITIRIGLPQIELGAFASSVICTYGTASTRAGDIADLVTPPPYSPLGTTYYAEFERMGTPVNSTSESSSGLWFFGTPAGTQVSAPFGFGTSNQIRVDMYNAGVQQCALSDFADPFVVHKLCARIAPNDARGAYDGSLTTLDTSVTMPASIPTTVRAIGRRESASHQMHGWLRELRIYETAVPDGELITATA